MRKKLLKPPSEHGEVLFIPEPQNLSRVLRIDSTIGTCHQLSIFHPGIAIRFIFIDLLNRGKKRMLFMDTDKTTVQARIPVRDGNTKTIDFLSINSALYSAHVPDRGHFELFLKNLEREVRDGIKGSSSAVIKNIERFGSIFSSVYDGGTLKELLAETFIRFCNIKCEYIFLSELLGQEEFYDFFDEIYRDDIRFRSIYNDVLDEYSQVFRFRYKNFPFPKLKNDELPFWLVHRGERFQLLKRDISPSDIKKYTILPKASPLTLYLRLHKTDIFLHGTGGANYEWVNERIIERFYKREPPPYFVMSATFYIDNIPERGYPYFFINPDMIRERLGSFLDERGVSLY